MDRFSRNYQNGSELAKGTIDYFFGGDPDHRLDPGFFKRIFLVFIRKILDLLEHSVTLCRGGGLLSLSALVL